MRTDKAQLESRTYRLAYQDLDFLERHALRPQRLALEFMKADMIMRERGIKSTIVVFGGARIPAPGQESGTAASAGQAKNLSALTHYYDEARRFARICSKYAATTEYREFIIATGGGPGIMEAGNRGAFDVGAPNIGLNIVLPHEQAPNPYITPELCFRFHYFAMRKMHFMLRAKALLAFPGGFGTMDELFEVLTLVQTSRMKPVPIVLFGEQFWRQAFNVEFLAEQGMIAPENKTLFVYADKAEAAWRHIARYYHLPEKP
ncbi:LOG family protein [Candidatus Tokpelaia sp.]|uniref:LOG family protein n=1 Tax=Candidatus Tokpelaia sp. TaxID=2233777 RepID=UPI001239828B|nr:LOG family protein [Candidatus Tokpelaia sp.]KAA6405819.1 3-isopropylmalate dehydrogenase [Candidatus Tokpelaia sp.]